jgi:hypothetical protein
VLAGDDPHGRRLRDEFVASGRSNLTTQHRPKEVEMPESLRRVGAITMFVEDPQRSKEFYERVFETSPV